VLPDVELVLLEACLFSFKDLALSLQLTF